MDYEKQADELLEALGKELHKSRLEVSRNFEKQSFSARADSEKRKKKRYRRLVWAAVICICVVTLGIGTVTSGAFRATLFGFFFSEEEGYNDVIRKDSSQRKVQILYPEYLPEGYKKVSEESDDTLTTLTYENKGTGDFLSITQIRDKDFALSIDAETSRYEKCVVKTYEAYYIGGNENHLLIWEENGCYVEIASMLEKEMLIKVANYLK